MKYIVFALFFFSICYSQTEIERQRIFNSYSLEKINALKLDARQKYELQQVLIKEYILQNNLPDSLGKYIQRIYGGRPYFFTEDNNSESAVTINVTPLYENGSLGLNLSGDNLLAGVWDGGKVRDTHIEFGNRVNQADNSTTLNSHATHVTGTIAAAGLSPLRRGIAFNSQIAAYDWTNDYQEMILFGTSGFLVSNHSYGYNASSLAIPVFGQYDGSSIEADNIANTFPYYQIVKSAGNNRNETNLAQVAEKGGYDLLAGVSTAKNVLTIAAVNQVSEYIDNSSVILSSFTNFGPTDDGRIKPDIAAQGVNVSSTISTTNNAYGVLSGTSMSAPAITGLILLLQEHYNNNFGEFLKSSQVRGLICHTAREAGLNLGPDYEHGWGLANGEAAINLISNSNQSTLFEIMNLQNNQQFQRLFQVNEGQKVDVTISWTDPTGVANNVGALDNRTPRLINNLDLKVLKDGEIFYPWKLNPDFPTDGATRDSDNNVDNIEKVEIDFAEPGVYTIQVSHKGTLQGGSQEFALIASGTNGLVLNQNEFQLDNSVFIYPNPAVDVLNYTLADGVSISSIELFDLTGKKIAVNHNTQAKVIDVASLQSGVYFVKFNSDSKSLIKKFVKK